jgi:SpoVK/Ycf46/Vps4 family AAA+-type ATPase
MLQNLSRLFINQQKSATTAEEKDEQRKKDKQHATTPWTADYIENKGKGLVFLLHGKPGVGKTYTAECIAHLVQRPLLSVTCADIGVEPSEIEEKLRRWFKIARRWDAIMLLDEADIYMEFRQTHDLTRNNLVASFLRAIEYYDGVLFLTTNRIGTFDETFLSRVTAIYYSDFDDDDRKRIWENYFEKLEQERADEIHVPRSTKEYAVDSTDVRELKWNGREIRNGEFSFFSLPFFPFYLLLA